MDLVLSLITIFLVLASSSKRSQGYSRNDFPKDFAFGAAVSAYQWEGAANEDGRKPSIWDTFAHTLREEDGGVACDGYHKYKEDVKLMVDTGLDAFRFSISWSRLIPNGRGLINPEGLKFYKNLIHELVTNGIEPHVTLFHYDLPQSLEDEYGGWRSCRIIEDFTAYVDVCFREFGNKVKFWNTINEANIFTIGGYDNGLSAPARCSLPRQNCSSGNSTTEPYIVAHNLLLAHASASRLYNKKYKDVQGGLVGFSMFVIGFKPCTNSKDDEIATQRARDFYFGWMVRPLIFGDYPDSMKQTVGSRLPVFTEEESKLVKGSADFLGVNHYLAAIVSSNKTSPSGITDFISDMGVSMTCNASKLLKSFIPMFRFLLIISSFVSLLGRIVLGNLSLPEYAVAPWAMEDVLEDIKQNYGNPPVYILENGTPVKKDSQLALKDTQRIEFLDAYIGAVLKAVRNGSDTRGYFVWSFIDLFEILSGYDDFFGMYYVNFSDPNLKRSPKLSAQWYSAFIKGNSTFLGSQGITQLQTNFSSSSL